MDGPDKEGVVLLHVKSPTKLDSVLSLRVHMDDDLAHVHKLITEQYDGNPPASDQTLIYAGKVMKDATVSIRKLIERVESKEGPHSLHLVVRPKPSPSASSSIPSPAASTSTAAPSTSRAQASLPYPSPAPTEAAASPAGHSSKSTSGDPGPSIPTSTQPSASPSASSTNSQPDAKSTPQQSTEVPQNPFYPAYVFVNPIMAAAYQAAYGAAMQVAASQQAQMQYYQAQASKSGAQGYNPMTVSFNAYNAQQKAYLAAWQQAQSLYQDPSAYAAAWQQAQSAASGSGAVRAAPFDWQQQQQQHLTMWQLGRPGQLPEGATLLRRRAAAAAPIPGAGLPGVAVGAEVAIGGGVGAAPGQQQPQVRQRLHRVYRLRVSARFLLQMLVFGVVLYQHFTWRRFVALVVGGLLLWVTTAWHPLRRLMAGVQAPAGPAAARQPNGQPVQRGILAEIMVAVLGFFTSLLPAWNYDPQEAAAFAAAQDVVAREEERARQQGGDAAAGGIDNVAAVAAEVEPPIGPAAAGADAVGVAADATAEPVATAPRAPEGEEEAAPAEA